MPGAGKLDRRLTVERYGEALDDFRAVVKTWTEVTKVWARRVDASDGEKFNGGQVEATRMTRFVIRSTGVTRAITAKDRVIEHGDTYELLGVKETKQGRLRFLELSAVARDDG